MNHAQFLLKTEGEDSPILEGLLAILQPFSRQSGLGDRQRCLGIKDQSLTTLQQSPHLAAGVFKMLNHAILYSETRAQVPNQPSKIECQACTEVVSFSTLQIAQSVEHVRYCKHVEVENPGPGDLYSHIQQDKGEIVCKDVQSARQHDIRLELLHASCLYGFPVLPSRDPDGNEYCNDRAYSLHPGGGALASPLFRPDGPKKDRCCDQGKHAHSEEKKTTPPTCYSIRHYQPSRFLGGILA